MLLAKEASHAVSLTMLSVVIPTHDTRALTLACLASLAEQAVDEVLLVDDASRDGTAEAVAARFPAVRRLVQETQQGFTRSANRGLAEARGDLLLLLNSDTEVAAGALAGLGALFAADPRLGIAGAALHYPDGSPQWSGGREPTLAWLFALASGAPALLARLPFYRRLKPLARAEPAEVEWVTGAAMVIRREVWEAVGPLDEGFAFYAQDLDFCTRARALGWRIEIRPELAVLHHHGATISRRPGATGRQHRELLQGDLVRWAAKHRGPGWARRARWTLRLGNVLRSPFSLLSQLGRGGPGR